MSRKPLAIAALAAATLGAAPARAEGPAPVVAETETPEPGAWTVQIDPLTFALGFVHVQVERRLHPNLSIYAGPSLHLFSAPWEDQEPFRGYGGEVGLRYFFFGEAPRGWWSQARGVVAYLETTDGTNLSRVGGYFSVLTGYTGVIAERLVLAGGLGIQYLDYEVGGYGPTGILPAAHTTVGVTF